VDAENLIRKIRDRGSHLNGKAIALDYGSIASSTASGWFCWDRPVGGGSVIGLPAGGPQDPFEYWLSMHPAQNLDIP
jgi:hypothetical protein